jgi:hypothetical protein
MYHFSSMHLFLNSSSPLSLSLSHSIGFTDMNSAEFPRGDMYLSDLSNTKYDSLSSFLPDDQRRDFPPSSCLFFSFVSIMFLFR